MAHHQSITMAITPLLALLLGVFCLPATADLLSYDPAALEYEIDSLGHVMDKLRCDNCRASLELIWRLTIGGPKTVRGLASQLSLRSPKPWSQGPGGIAETIEAIIGPEVLPQRYVGVKTSPGNYELWPLVNMAGALDSTRKTSEALGPMGKEITDEVNLDTMLPDETTRPKYAMYKLVGEMVGKVGLYDLADMIYKIHARSFGSSGPKQFTKLEQSVCVELTQSCEMEQMTRAAPWEKAPFKPQNEPAEQPTKDLNSADFLKKEKRGEL